MNTPPSPHLSATTTASLRVQHVAFGLAAGVLGAATNRMGVWVQGCTLACPGCASPHTHDSADPQARRTTVAELLHGAERHQPGGLTVSGGEPTEQAEGVLALVQSFQARWPGREVVLYTGLRWPVLLRRFPALAGAVDVVVAGPYVQHLPATPLAGSSNQQVQLLTPLARRLFAGHEGWPLHRLQVAARVGDAASGWPVELVTVGIPQIRRSPEALPLNPLS